MQPIDTHNVSDYTAGDTLVLQYTIRTIEGAVPELSGATWRYAVAPVTPRGIGAAIFTKTLGSGIQVMDAAAGIVRVTVSEGDVPDGGTYHHELEMTLAGGESYTVMRGRITAKAALLVNA